MLLETFLLPDETVCAALLKKALNADQIIAIHIDNGFMRKRESEAVRDSLAKVGLGVKGKFTCIVPNHKLCAT